MENENRFAICIRNEGYPVSLDLGKVYPIIADLDAEEDGMIRVIDESGEDYLFDGGRFVVITLPVADAHVVLQAIEVPATIPR
ncbi:MAG: hypothetical protein QOF63_2260 [Thermoanaerobaculia bacterium]|jgi:hypothetical protein|nr:hypothetical protein [Thermoanaerobaculia bacterium]MEA2417497.1 hypothetical protein [Thermoanaerobaculia bacterium]